MSVNLRINFRSIRFKLIVGGVLAVLSPIVVLNYISIEKSSQALTGMAKENAGQVAKDLVVLAELSLTHDIKLTQQMAADPLIATVVSEGMVDVRALNKYLTGVFPGISDSCDSLFIADNSGKIIADSSGGTSADQQDIRVDDRDYFSKAKAGETNIGSPVLSRASGNPVAVVAVPLKDAAGRFAGIFASVLKLNFLSEQIEKIKVGTTGYPYLVDRNGLIIAHPRKELIFKLNVTTQKGMEGISANMLAGKAGVEGYVFQGVKKIAAFAPILLTGWSIGVTQNEEESQVAARAIRRANILVAVIAGFLTAVVVVFSSRAIVGPINAAVAQLKDIAQGEGDLTRRLEVKSRDEMGELAKWFNEFIDKLRTIIKNVRGGVETLSSSSTELSAVSEQINQGIQDVTEKSNTVSAAAEEMNASMQAVAGAMEQSAANMGMVASSSEEMSSTIDEIAKNAEKARVISEKATERTSQASGNVDRLGLAAQSIGKVVGTITEISEQVNLLALNATIEAARAGEAGRGFAVVANEIKDLARQTAEATKDIKNKIENIQSTTGTTIDQISEINTIINEVNNVVANIAAAVEQQSTATREISSNIAQGSQGIQEVNENVSQSSSVSEEICKDIARVSSSMNEMSTGSSQIKTSAQELSLLSENLKRMVGQFQI